MVTYPEDRTKTAKESIRTFGEDIRDILCEFLDRRARHDPQHEMLWINRWGAPAGRDALYVALRKFTRNELPVPLTPHRLRDAAATLILREAPAEASLASLVLDHDSEDMRDHYTETAGRIQASIRGAELIDAAGNAAMRKLREAGVRSRMALLDRPHGK